MKKRKTRPGRPGALWLMALALVLLSACRTPAMQEESATLETAEPVPIEEIMSTKSGPIRPGDLLQRYRQEGLAAQAEIERGLAELRGQDPEEGELWARLFEEMFYVNQGATVNEGEVPSDLPEDDSLCIVVFGFCLEADGSMAEELVGRCETALACAQAYPHSRVAVTGGPTAADGPRTTEAREMARWLTQHGVAGERIIVEERALSTMQNAVYLEKILTDSFPQVKSLVIVSSSYHVPLCSLLMTETALLDACEQGSAPYEVVSNLGFPVAEHGSYDTPAVLADYVWALAQAHLKGEDGA